jgi:hypothetical protein
VAGFQLACATFGPCRSSPDLAVESPQEIRVELRAIAEAKAYWEREGYCVDHVSGKKGHGGYDFLVSRADERLKVEVKGCSREWQIPDLYATEFDAQNRLVADILCVVYLLKDRDPSICLIPRDAIRPEDVKQKTGFRISSRFKKRVHLEQYWKPLRG